MWFLDRMRCASYVYLAGRSAVAPPKGKEGKLDYCLKNNFNITALVRFGSDMARLTSLLYSGQCVGRSTSAQRRQRRLQQQNMLKQVGTVVFIH